MNDALLKVYEPFAPGPQARLRTLQQAAAEGIPLYVAVAPTYPECGEDDLRATLRAIRPLNPLTIFHEPINVRAENIERIARYASGLKPPIQLRTEVFDNGPAWRRYAVDQLMTMQGVAQELGMERRLHLWPDKALISRGAFLKARTDAFRQARPGYRETAFEKEQCMAADEAAYEPFSQWLSHWHQRISEWPGKKS